MPMLTKLSNSLSNRATILTAAGLVAVGSSVVSSYERFQDKDDPPKQNSFHASCKNNLAWEYYMKNLLTSNVCILKYPSISMSYNLLPSSTNRTVAQCEKNKEEENDDESIRFQKALAYHQSQIQSYRRKWEYSANSVATTSTKTPSRSWPDDIPSTDDLSWLLQDIKYCKRSPNFRSDKEYCNRLMFRVASALLLQFDDESHERGLQMLRQLAEGGYPDAMVYYGMCLNDGRAGRDPDSVAAVSWFKRCNEMYEHKQAQYELGVALYTGEGIAEDEEEAVRMFRLAADQHHPSACYMLGDCLLDGVGVAIDRASALEWLIRSGELGHRGARSRVMAVLEKKEGEDYDGFTDSSRQTFAHAVLTTNKDGHIVRRMSTMPLQKIGGGSRNPTELARRQTIVSKSKQ